NPDLVLCTLDEGAEIRMEFTVNTGKGYVPAERNRPDDAPIGLTPVDSLFSPARKVSYKPENTREGQILDYDKLTKSVETKGAGGARLCGAHPAGSGQRVRQLRGAEEGGRGRDHPGSRLQPGVPQEGG